MSRLEKDEYIKIISDLPWIYSPILSAIDEFVAGIESILDVGCGNGLLLDLIKRRYPNLELTGIDIDPYFIERAKKAYSHEFHIEDGYSFTHTADLIISNLALHHFEEPERLVEHMLEQARVGVVICDHVRPETEEELAKRLERRLSKHSFGKSEYYKTRGREAILEAYSKKEIRDIFKSTDSPPDISFIDNDYFERFVAVYKKI